MQAPRVNGWGFTAYSTPDGTRPVGNMGASVTPAQNAYGSYAQLLGALAFDCWDLTIVVNTVGISTVARDCLVSIGIDPSGGTSFTSIVDLVCGPASTYLVSGGVLAGGTSFRFPLFIRAGSSIGAAASVNSATLTAINVFCRVKGQPTNPDVIRVGTFIDQFGVTTASSNGTAITPGTVSEGAFTQIGSALTRPCWYWEYGYGINNGTMQNGAIDVDIAIGDASNKLIVIPNAPVFNSANEVLLKPRSGEYYPAAAGALVYGRSQAGGTLETGHSIAVYGVGG